MKNKILVSDIPDIPLYMDQIITLLDDKLSDNKINPEDKILTKTMINNYSKENLIYKVKGKTYNKNQIIQMILVYYLKNGLSMQEIKELLLPIYEDENSIITLYQSFLDNQEKRENLIENILSSYEDDQQQILELIELSNQLQTIAKTKIKALNK